MKFEPTPVTCQNCGARDHVVTRKVGDQTVVELPTNWKRVGMGRASRGILWCGRCYLEAANKVQS